MVVAGRTLRVGPPTVAAVYRLLDTCGDILLATAEAASRREVFGEDDVEAIVALLAKRPAFADVLQHVVSDDRGLPVADLGAMHERDLVRIALTSLSLCDSAAIADEFDLIGAFQRAKAGEQITPPVDFDPQAYSFVKIAQALGVDPHTLMGWSYEAYMAAREALSVTADDLRMLNARPLSPGAIPGISIERAADGGVQ